MATLRIENQIYFALKLDFAVNEPVREINADFGAKAVLIIVYWKAITNTNKRRGNSFVSMLIVLYFRHLSIVTLLTIEYKILNDNNYYFFL